MERLTIVFFTLMVTTLSVFSQPRHELLDNFQQSDWVTVYEAKQKIEDMETEYIPDLISMLDEKKTVRLNNTGDLIYPGAEKFYGHGRIIDYDIDHLDIRAGWLLEDITFENFGFSGIHIRAERLVPLVKYTYPAYYRSNEKMVDEMTEAQLRKLIRQKSIASAQEWWEQHNNSWTRLEGLVNALNSNDQKRHIQALHYLRHGTTKCTGLDNKFYRSDLHKIILRLSKSDIKRISEQAQLILDDTSQEWLKMKQ